MCAWSQSFRCTKENQAPYRVQTPAVTAACVSFCHGNRWKEVDRMVRNDRWVTLYGTTSSLMSAMLVEYFLHD